MPGYSQMRNWCHAVGLEYMFFDEEEGIMNMDPGYTTLHQSDLKTIRKAVHDYELKHPNCKNHIPFSDSPGVMDEPQPGQILYDWDYGKLLWYEFWIDWALANCKYPIIAIR